MISKELNDWLQVIGLFGVLGGLIFVGLQLQLDRRVALSEMVGDAAIDRKYWAELVTQNAEVWLKGSSGEPLAPVEMEKFEVLAAALELQYFTSYNRAVQFGGLPPQRWINAAALEFHESPGLLAFWRRLQDRFDRIGDEPDAWAEGIDAELRRLEEQDASR